jgi:DNA-binding response OmpR family regulator
MKVLVAEDDPVSRRALEVSLRRWGYEVVTAADGAQAWETLQRDDAPRLALLDWIMPGLDGVEVCRHVRGRAGNPPTYLILLSAKASTEDVVLGLECGADDYLTKPVELPELRARLKAGGRILELQSTLAERVRELNDAMENVRQLQRLLPICSYCKKVRNDQNYWQQVEAFLSARLEMQFSHSICPECFEHIVKPELASLAVSMPENPLEHKNPSE